MQIDAYILTPGAMEAVGVSFFAKSRHGLERFHFWVPTSPDRFYLFRWDAATGWRSLPSTKLSDKRLAALRQFWSEQSDRGFWIQTMNRLKRRKYNNQAREQG